MEIVHKVESYAIMVNFTLLGDTIEAFDDR